MVRRLFVRCDSGSLSLAGDLAMPRISDELVDIFDLRHRLQLQHNHHGLETGTLYVQECSAGVAPIPEGTMAGFQCVAPYSKRLALRGMYHLAAAKSPIAVLIHHTAPRHA